jgi:hypothetical protein
MLYVSNGEIKSDWVARLTPDILSFLMAVSIQGPEPMDYNAASAMEL